MVGLEPTTSRSQSECAAQLRHIPLKIPGRRGVGTPGSAGTAGFEPAADTLLESVALAGLSYIPLPAGKASLPGYISTLPQNSAVL